MVGEKLGSFRIEGTLGVGAMGVVYKATHEPTGKAAAVKVISKELAPRGNAYDRFKSEAEHPQAVPAPEHREVPRPGPIQGDLVLRDGVHPRQRSTSAQRAGPLPWKEVVDLAFSSARPSLRPRARGRPPRPEAVEPDGHGRGTVKLTDFGIAKDLDATALTATGRTLGTAAYMAPEQIRGTPAVSHKTDLYALGIVLYQVLDRPTAVRGFVGGRADAQPPERPVPRPSAKVAEIPKALDDLLVKLMAKSPTDRPWDAAAVGETLKTIRDKAERGETVAMVWPTEGADAAAATLRATQSAGKKKRSAPSSADRVNGKSLKVRRRWRPPAWSWRLWCWGGFVAYMLWPPSAPYLYKQAEADGDGRATSGTRRFRDYIDPLDRRFPTTRTRRPPAAGETGSPSPRSRAPPGCSKAPEHQAEPAQRQG